MLRRGYNIIMESERVIEHVVVAEFDKDLGAVVRVQFP